MSKIIKKNTNLFDLRGIEIIDNDIFIQVLKSIDKNSYSIDYKKKIVTPRNLLADKELVEKVSILNITKNPIKRNILCDKCKIELFPAASISELTKPHFRTYKDKNHKVGCDYIKGYTLLWDSDISSIDYRDGNKFSAASFAIKDTVTLEFERNELGLLQGNQVNNLNVKVRSRTEGKRKNVLTNFLIKMPVSELSNDTLTMRRSKYDGSEFFPLNLGKISVFDEIFNMQISLNKEAKESIEASKGKKTIILATIGFIILDNKNSPFRTLMVSHEESMLINSSNINIY